MNKEQLHKELEDCWDDGYENGNLAKPRKQKRETYITTRLAALDGLIYTPIEPLDPTLPQATSKRVDDGQEGKGLPGIKDIPWFPPGENIHDLLEQDHILPSAVGDLADALIYVVTEANDNGDEYGVIRGKVIKTLVDKWDVPIEPLLPSAVKERAIGFDEWKRENDYHESLHRPDRWYIPSRETDVFVYFTNEQLYELYQSEGQTAQK